MGLQPVVPVERGVEVWVAVGSGIAAVGRASRSATLVCTSETEVDRDDTIV